MKKPTFLFLSILILFFAQINLVSAEEDFPSIDPEFSGRLEGEGTHFELMGSDYLNITLDSSEPIKVVLESIPEIVALDIEPVSEATSTQITLSGFEPLTTYYKYEDGYQNLDSFISDGLGKYTYIQDLSKHHFVYIQPNPSTIFLNEDGWSNPSVGTWNSLTRIATLNTDLNQSIQINVDNMTLEGNGYTITGNNTGVGVALYGRTGVSIKNIKIQMFSIGFDLRYSANNEFISNILIGNSSAFNLRYSSINNKLIDNSIIGNSLGFGIFLYQSGNNTLRNNSVTENRFNFAVDGSALSHYKNDIDTTNLVEGRPIYYLVGVSDMEIGASTNAGQVYCINCDNVTVKDLEITGNVNPHIYTSIPSAGIYFYNTSNSRIENNVICDNVSGIRLDNSSSNSITNNAVANNFFGLSLFYSQNNSVSNNTVNSNSGGIYCTFSYSNLLEYNTTINNAYGIYFRASSNNTIIENTIGYNSSYGIVLQSYASYNSLNNNIYHNNFMANATQAYTYGGDNFFNLDLPIGGNYWSDWTSPDSNGDGIVDSPYEFTTDQDDYPWDTKDWWKAVESDALVETSFTETTLVEDIVSKEAILSLGVINGEIEGAFSFSNFEIVSVATGLFEGQGFFKGEVQFTIGAASYSGNYTGVNYFRTGENKIYLKGVISGGISGIVEGYLSESIPASGIYDQFEATGEINKLGSGIIYAAIGLTGNFTYLYSYDYPSTGLYFLQSNLEGEIGGEYETSANVILNHLRITSGNNPYIGQGFSAISYTSRNGSGQGWTYDESFESGRVELRGFFNNSFAGIASGVLDETVSPRTLSLSIQPIDSISPPTPDLKISVISQTNVSPGETFNYVIEYRNDGLVAATDAVVLNYLDLLAEFVSASEGAYYDPYSHQVSWNLGALPPKTTGYLSIQAKLPWGLPEASFENRAYILDIVFHSDEINGIGTGICTNSENENRMKLFLAFCKANNAEPTIVFDNTNIVTGPMEVLSASEDERTSRNGVGENTDVIPGPIFVGYRPVWIGYSGSATSIVNQAKNDRLSGDVLYLISPQLITQDDLRAIRSQFNKIVVYQGDDFIEDKSALGLKVSAGIDGVFSRDELIYGGANILPPDDLIGYLISGLEGRRNKEFDYLQVFPKEAGNRIRITWIDGAFEDFTITHTILPEDNIETLTTFEIRHQEWIMVLLLFVNKYERMPTNEDTDKFITLFREFKKGKLDNRLQQITTARDPNEKFVSPESNIESGDLLSYTITYENEGDGIAYGVYIIDTLDEDLNEEALVINEEIGNYDSGTRTITWLVGEVGPHEEGSFSFQIAAKDNLPENTEIINYATVYFPSVPEETKTNAVVNIANAASADDEPPVTQISVSPTANGNEWHNSDIIVTLTASDNEGGSEVKDIHYSLVGAVNEEQTVQGNSLQLLIANEGLTTLSYFARDNQGNVELANQTDLRLDKTPPELTMPVLDSKYIYNSEVLFNFSASDSTSGIESSSATFNGDLVENGDSVGLSKLGQNTFILEATDHAGNIESRSIVFDVEYAFSGFLPPVEADGSGVYKEGRTLPLKFQLQDVNQTYVSSTIATLTLQQFSDETPIGQPIEVESTSGADTGNTFRYDTEENQYIFNLNTKNLSPGTWQLQIHLDDGATKTGIIKLK